MVLHGANLIEQSQRIETLGEFPEARLDFRRDVLRRHQPGGWRLRSQIPLNDPRAVSMLISQLERRLEKVNEESGTCVKPAQRLPSGNSFQTRVANHSSYDGAVLLLYPCLIILKVRPRSGQ